MFGDIMYDKVTMVNCDHINSCVFVLVIIGINLIGTINVFLHVPQSINTWEIFLAKSSPNILGNMSYKIDLDG